METTETVAAEPDIEARVKEILDAFVVRGAPGAASPATFAFDLTGEHGGHFLLKLGTEGVSWEKAAAEGADVTVRLTAADFVAIADGQFDGRLAVASERIEISGDRALAERMLELVDPDAA
jgi:putative sterol carrier protein